MWYPPSSARRARRAVLALALASPAAVLAQYPGGAIVQPRPGADDPAERLAAALRTLAVSPRDLAALIEAGRDALTLGDPNAAVGFFGRASEVSPRDGRVKAGLGAALVQLEKPRDALRYFQEASALGVPDADLAEDRGLAYDLVGDPAQAQRDYRTAIAARPDDDAARRDLALSQGIAGDRVAAIATLDPLIRKRDIAAWRAQTFVLAMTGDTKGANDITRIMLPQQQAMLQPFLERLATLPAGDKARAVHFGEMPAGGRNYSDTQLASIGTPPTYAPPAVVAHAPPAAIPAAVPPRTPAAVTAPARVASVPVVAPVSVATTGPAPTVAHPRFVSATGQPMRRIEHSAQEMMALGMPRYEYVPLTDGESPRAPSPAVHVAQVVPAPAPISAVAPVRIATVLPPPATAPAAIAPPPAGPPTPTPATAIAAPTAIVAVAPSSPVAVAMPLGGDGSAGHFDVPHEIADRRPAPRIAQQTARPAEIAATQVPSPGPASALGSANPTVATARHARDGGEVTRVERPARADAAPIESPPPDAHKRTAETHGRTAGTSTASDDEASPKPGKGRRGDHVRIGSRDEDTAKTEGVDHDAAPDRKTSRGRHKGQDDAGPPDETRGGDRTDGDRKHAAGKSSKASPDRDTPDRRKSEPAEPRVYVQVAGGANRDDLDKAWDGVKAKAPALMKGKTPSTTPLHATNRLLVGPFKDEDEAQAFVNKMAGKGVSGFTFKSGKGQKVEKVDTGK